MLEGCGREARAVVGDLDDQRAPSDRAQEVDARARVLGGVGHEVGGGAGEGRAVERDLGLVRDAGVDSRGELHAARTGSGPRLGHNLAAELGRQNGGLWPRRPIRATPR